ncbi:MAG: hypothetical protein FWF82_02965 [Oscillospiraceae bacterium]|nr:hypothetical protein [Oscillospiraceae bacterium]
MGFFDKLKEIVNQTEKVIQSANDTINNANNARPPSMSEESPQPESKPVTASAAPVSEPEPVVVNMYGSKPRPYMAEILSSEFSQYEVRENIPLSEFGKEGRAYDFGLYQNGEAKAFIVLSEHNRTRNHPYWNSEKNAKEMNVPFINFFTHMANEKSYVIGRIKKFLGI